MSAFDRRNFLKVGAGSVAGLALGGPFLGREVEAGNLETAVPASGPSLREAYFLEPGVISRFDTETLQTFRPEIWALHPEFGTGAVATLAPDDLGLGDLESWAERRTDVPNHDRSLRMWGKIDQVLGLRLSGGPNLSELAAASMLNLRDRGGLDLALDFFHSPDLASSRFRLSEQAGLPALETTVEPIGRGGGAQLPLYLPTVAVTLYGWRLQFRGPETHPLGSCVASPVKHFHVELFRQNQRGGFDYVVNFHLGTYLSGGKRCFVLFNNVRPQICWKICGPSYDDLKRMYSYMLLSAAALVGVSIAAWIVALIASAAAAATYASLLLLV